MSGYWQKVDDLDAASRTCLDYINFNDLGGGNWAGGEVRDAETKQVVAKISYNGRIWMAKEPSEGPRP